MPIQDLCSKNLVCVNKNASLKYAALLMKNHHVGGLIVIESDGVRKPIGVITDRDIVLNMVSDEKSTDTKVADAMSSDLMTVNKEMGIADVIDQMENAGVRKMVVIDKAGNACGLVTSDDILQLLAREMYGIGRLVERQVEIERTKRPRESHLVI